MSALYMSRTQASSTHYFVVYEKHDGRQQLITILTPALLDEACQLLNSFAVKVVALLNIFDAAKFKMCAGEGVNGIHDGRTAMRKR